MDIHWISSDSWFICIVWDEIMQQSDIIEIRLYDATYQIFFKGKARIRNKREMLNLKAEIKDKGITLFDDDWFG